MATTNAKKTDESAETMVKIRLFKDGNKYKDDVPVIVNGKCWQVQRGVTVEVPEVVAEALEWSMEQDAKTAEMITRLGEEYKTKAKNLGV